MDAGVKRLIGLAVALAMIAGAMIVMVDRWKAAVSPTPETIATASLLGLREQNRLSAFAARFVAVVTSEESRFGLSAKKTLIMPGTVRYEVDLSTLRAQDVRWDAASSSLHVTLPPVSISGPEIDLTQIREYDAGGILMALTNAEAELDAANRKAGQAELLKQARESVMLRLAQDATRRAVAASFAMPLRAAGLMATVTVKFAGEA
jgi:hypothetical protein